VTEHTGPVTYELGQLTYNSMLSANPCAEPPGDPRRRSTGHRNQKGPTP
jgi:hypothetical protein